MGDWCWFCVAKIAKRQKAKSNFNSWVKTFAKSLRVPVRVEHFENGRVFEFLTSLPPYQFSRATSLL